MWYALARQALFTLPAEASHDIGLRALDLAARGPVARRLARRVPDDPRQLLGLTFRNPVGLAAGLDKNADHVDALGALGFGFIEVGTVTPRPQPGNPRPRLFRIQRRDALVNRMGFNNKGVAHVVERLRARRYAGVVGVNIGKNRDTPVADALLDYRQCLEQVHAVADYVTVNVSSPNTPGLRSLQSGPALDTLLGGLVETGRRLDAASDRAVPLLIKIAPDIDTEGVEHIARAVLEHGFDGIIATNTTSDHSALAGCRHANEEGGVSGAPLAGPATAALRTLAEAVEGRVPLVGVGGILAGADAAAKGDAGASLVQLYTGLIYRGPDLVREAADALRARAA